MSFDLSLLDLTRYEPATMIAIVVGFAAALLLIQSVISIVTIAQARQTVNRRLMFKEKASSTEELIVTLRRQRALDEKGEFSLYSRRFNELVTRSGATFQPVKWAVMSGLLSIVLFGVIFWRLDNLWIAVGVALASFPLTPLMILKSKAVSRRKKLAAQLPDALQIVVRSLEAGHPIPSAIALVARETPDPIGTEFGMAADEIAYGFSLTKGIERMAQRAGDADVDLFAATVRLQERTGGNLCELLKTNVKAIRERQTLRLKVRAASSEGRASAMILTSAPFIIMGAIHLMRPEFYGLVAHERMFLYGLAILGVWMLIGNIIMNRMVNFRF